MQVCKAPPSSVLPTRGPVIFDEPKPGIDLSSCSHVFGTPLIIRPTLHESIRAIAGTLAALLLSASIGVSTAQAQFRSEWSPIRSSDFDRQLENRLPPPPVPRMPFKSPVMQRVWAIKHHHDAKSGDNPADLLSSPFLTTPAMYSVGSSAAEVALGDFNGDGKQDAIVASNPPLLLLGNGDGTFQSAVQIGNSDSAASSVGVADFNHDGRLDAVFVIASAVVVYLGHGDGTFDAGTAFYSGFSQVLVRDVNNDGNADLILSGCSDVCVLLGNGDGSFQAPISSRGIPFSVMSAADVNKDGRTDLVVTDGFQTLGVLLGNGDGTFSLASEYSVAANRTYAMAVADYNGDGLPDVALPTGQIFLGNGDGTLRIGGAFPTVTGATVVLATDVNADGIVDLLAIGGPFFCGQSDFGTTGVSLGQGDGTFRAATIYATGGCYSPTEAILGDLNGDGVFDVAMLIGSPVQLTALIGKGNGAFLAAQLNNSGGAGRLVVDDFNGDGNADILFGDGTLYVGNGDGTSHVMASTPLGAVSVSTGDFNHDGNRDVAGATECTSQDCSGGGALVIALGKGDGSFDTPTELPSGGFYAESLAVADFNSDGNLDVALVNNCVDEGCSGTGSVSIYLGNADGTFLLLNTMNTASDYPSTIAIGDFNNDGVPDLAVGLVTTLFQEPTTVNIFLGTGDGTFEPPIIVETPDKIGITDLTVGDFNNDGMLDLALANGVACADCGGHGSILYGNGDGSFTFGAHIGTSGGPPASIVTADFYGTGTTTPVLANRCIDFLDCPNGSVMIYGTDNVTDIMLLFLAVGDFNNDGKPDLVGSLEYDSGLSILLNVGAAAAATTTTISPVAPQTYSRFQPITFTAEVRHTGPGTPAGNVEFLDNGVSLGSAPLEPDGQASFTGSELPVGAHFVVARYDGGGDFAISNSLGAHVTIDKANTTTTETSSINPSQYGQNVTFTAAVTGQYGGTPSGNVTFRDGSIDLGTSPLSGGVAELSAAWLATGTHAITAAYDGDADFAASTSSPLEQVVNKSATATTLNSSPNPCVVGQPVTFTAAVLAQYGGVPKGTVTFKSGTTVLAEVRLKNAQAQFSKSFESVGTKLISAVYSGNMNFARSASAPLQQITNQATTTTTLYSSPNPSKVGQSVDFTAIVAPQYGGTPTGTVTFTNGNTVMGKVKLKSGQANLKKVFNSPGSKTISADYGGDANFSGSSDGLTQKVK